MPPIPQKPYLQPPPSLYISDLDGTLLRKDGKLDSGCRKDLRTLIESGLPFSVASARSMFSIKQILGDLPIDLPVVNFNGAFLSDYKTGRHVVVNAISPLVSQEIYDLLPKFRCVPFLSTFNGTDDRVYYNQIINDGMEWYLSDRFEKKDVRWRKSSNLRCELSEQVVCFTLIATSDLLHPLKEELLDRYGDAIQIHLQENMYSPGWFWLTIHDGKATKSGAIAALRKRHALDKHRLVVFGDQVNDLPMFRVADHAVAVGNAIDVVQKAAHEVIGSNNEGSVVQYLRDQFHP